MSLSEKDRERIQNAAVFAAGLCMEAGENQAFYDGFWQRLLAHPKLLAEFVYYCEKGDFACKYKIDGRSVADILVWQIDNFKAAMDRERNGLRDNPAKMVLYAFDTMTKAAEAPRSLTAKMAEVTGSDYPGKY